MKCTVKRAPRDKEHPYAQIPRSFISDFSISLELKAILLYCFSRKDGWEYHVTQLASIHKIGYRKLLRLLAEGIKAGYIKRLPKRDGNLTHGWEYLFDEEKEFSNNISDVSNLGMSEARHVDNDKLLTNESSLPVLEKKEEYINKSAEARSLALYLFQRLQNRSPGFKEPNIDRWAKEMDKLLQLDHREEEDIIRMIDFSETHKFYKQVILSPSALRKHFDAMVIAKAAVNEQERINANRQEALKAKERYPEKLKMLSFNDKYVINASIGKEVPFDLPTETFRRAFASLFGGKYDG